ncbi:MAG: MlaD family protein [Candidatus Zixiibacteriota bacterium]
MRRSNRVAWGEVRIGMAIIFAFTVLMWAAFNGSGFTFFKKSNSLVAYFDDIAGLATGSPVWLGGIEVGHVSEIRFVEGDERGSIRVTIQIKTDAWNLVSNESTASIGTVGLMGDKYVAVSLRQPGQPPAIDGAVIQTDVAGDLTTAFSSAPEMMDNLSTTISHLNAVLERIEKGEGYLGRLTSQSRSSDELDSLVVASRDMMRELTKTQKRLVASVENAGGALDSLATAIRTGGGSLSQLIYDTTLYANLASLTARTDRLVAQWEHGDGTVGKLMSDSSMYVEVRELVTDTRWLLDDIMANPKKYFKFSVF